jgi:hypothetical protein
MGRVVIAAFAVVVLGIIGVAVEDWRWNSLSDHERAMATLEAYNEEIVETCRAQFYAIMKDTLRDPESLELIEEIPEATESDGGIVLLRSVTFKYRARNGFGGMSIAEQKIKVPVKAYTQILDL